MSITAYEYDSGIEYLPDMFKSMDLFPNTAKIKLLYIEIYSIKEIKGLKLVVISYIYKHLYININMYMIYITQTCRE